MSNQNDSNGSSGRSSTRRLKQNKVPQRGLGVEKLERIRLEEQIKNGAGAPGPPPVVLPLPHHHQYQSPTAPDLSSLSSPSVRISGTNLLAPHPSHIPKLYTQNTNQTVNRSIGPALGWSAGVGASNGASFNTSFGSEYTKFQTEFGSGSSSSLQHDSKPNWPPLLLMQWRQHSQYQFPSLMNPPISTSSSSAPNFEIEPPSNQNTYGTYTPPSGHHEKMVGMKRSWPFSLDNLPDPSIPCNLTSLVPSFQRSDESYGRGNQVFREVPSVSTQPVNVNWRENSPELKLVKRIKDNGLDGEFLSLSLPATASCSSSTPKFKHPLVFPRPDYHELSKIDALHFQGNMEDQVIHSRGYVQPQYSFFPPKEQHIGRSTSNSKSEVVDGVDLSLKL
ncbi:hypothetical protein IFM89_019515 [Coptis chinensis]|uniref:Uncharacterized protein n=1 Tax=Coptis chinensis TaxID=261450 RepID=A0A835I3K2_9MAGN|nr:hypothetical protein IFM89_019515 [Coptis chinensis]